MSLLAIPASSGYAAPPAQGGVRTSSQAIGAATKTGQLQINLNKQFYIKSPSYLNYMLKGYQVNTFTISKMRMTFATKTLRYGNTNFGSIVILPQSDGWRSTPGTTLFFKLPQK